MKSIAALAIIVAAGALAQTAAAATQKYAICKFAINGKTYINGRCGFDPIGSDGSFRIFDKVHTVYVSMDGDTAEGFWNGIPKSHHADTHLGTLTRHGACWTNATAQVCASAR